MQELFQGSGHMLEPIEETVPFEEEFSFDLSLQEQEVLTLLSRCDLTNQNELDTLYMQIVDQRLTEFTKYSRSPISYHQVHRAALSQFKMLLCLEIERRKAEHRATHDPLTGLLNRTGFNHNAELFLKHADQSFAVLFIDANGLKQINDTYGHEIGDQVLKASTQIYLDTLPEGSIIGRNGGDEFIAIIPECKSAEALEMLGLHLNQVLAETYLENGLRLPSVAVGGVISQPNIPISIHTLIAKADEAMYKHKQEFPEARQNANLLP